MRATLDRVRRTGDDGFTLIELLIVIIILGILAGIVVLSVRGINNNAAKNACNTEVGIVDTAEEAEIANGGSEVTAMATLVSDGFLHSPPKYVASYDTATHKVVLVAGAPAGCTAA